jgi:diaminohydroxyphosphoribosylaminopyrimidine deaminase/5-amino-6-(5-phosphoribosylamino)uracil reductase
MWITGAAARQDVQKLRAQSGAILTATGTVIEDNPSLNVRLNLDDLNLPDDSQNKAHPLQQPKRVIIDSNLSTPTTAKLLGLEGETWIFTINDNKNKINELHNAGAEVIVLKADKHEPNKVPLKAVLLELAQREINEVHVEAGATLCGALLYAGLVDEIVLYMAAHIMGNNTRALFNLPKHNKMHQRIEVKIQDIRAIGDDWRISAIPTTINFNCSSH